MIKAARVETSISASRKNPRGSKDSRKERLERVARTARWKSVGENIRASERGSENYRALVDGCFWRALEDQEYIRGDSWGGSERARGRGIKGSGEVQSMKGLDVKPLRVAIFSTLGRTIAATATATTAAAHP